MLGADRSNGSVEAIWDQIRSVAKNPDFRVVCAFAAIGLAAWLGLAFVTATSSGSAALSDQIDPLQMMMNSKNLPAPLYDDYSLVFIERPGR
jgi:hypothetical protein